MAYTSALNRVPLPWNALQKCPLTLRCRHQSIATGVYSNYPVAGVLPIQRTTPSGEEECRLLLVLYREWAYEMGVPLDECAFPVSVHDHYPYLLTGVRRIYHRPHVDFQAGRPVVTWSPATNQNPQARNGGC